VSATRQIAVAPPTTASADALGGRGSRTIAVVADGSEFATMLALVAAGLGVATVPGLVTAGADAAPRSPPCWPALAARFAELS
jgi:DNA-binding transcriptional LysR family regulator